MLCQLLVPSGPHEPKREQTGWMVQDLWWVELASSDMLGSRHQFVYFFRHTVQCLFHLFGGSVVRYYKPHLFAFGNDLEIVFIGHRLRPIRIRLRIRNKTLLRPQGPLREQQP